MTISEIKKTFDDLITPHIDRWQGLFAMAVLSIAVNHYLFFKLELLFQFIKSTELILFAGLNFFLIFPYWFFRIRKLKKFKVTEAGIIIALTKTDSEIDKELISLYKKLDSTIRNENLSLEVKTYLLPDRASPKNEKQAHKLRDSLRGLVIIWGEVESGNQKGEKLYKFSPIRFSYRLPLSPDKAKLVNNNISKAISNRYWYISEKNSLIDRGYLAQNLEEVSFYIIGVSLFLGNYFKDSTSILSSLFQKYKKKVTKTTDDIWIERDIKSIIGAILRKCAMGLQLWPNSKNKAESIEEAKKLAVIAQSFVLVESQLHFNAQIAFSERNFSKAISDVQKCISLIPNDSAAYVSLAYLYFYNNEIDKGWFNLKAGFSKSSNNLPTMREQIVHVIRFYEEAIKEDPRKQYLNFPLGYIYFKILHQNNLAKESLQTFLNNCDNNDKRAIIQSLKFQATKMIRKIEVQRQ